MLLSRLVPQQEPITTIVERDWHQDILVMVRDRLPKVLLVLLFLFILQRVVHFFVMRMHRLADRRSGNSHRAAQLRTMATTLRATAYGIIALFAFLQVLNLFNIPYGPLLASAGIVGVGIGLGAQSLFKDIINGIFILIEDQYNVGEAVRIAGLTGSVESLTLRSTTLRDPDGTLYTIPNSQVATVANMSRDFSVGTLQLSVDACANPDQVLDLLRPLVADLAAEPAFKDLVLAPPDVPGVGDIRGREVIYPISLRVRTNQKDAMLRELRRRIILTFEQNGIPLGISANMLVMQNKPDPTATPTSLSPLGT